MTEVAIALKNISKCFKRYRNPADRLKELLLPGKTLAEEFWAVRDINLEVYKGQTLGVVGRNGSGKSTLLQIIVGTLMPTGGNVHVNGRISALLELGSGFNPEFTGRQNVFFNGQLLGLTPKEIEEKFDEIAGFADIGDFIDQPVKTYSSGMFVRLGFAVATSVEPDILVVDEALSVGDEAFQRKCFGRIQSIQERGGTILFVSHVAASVIQLCDSAILMDHGEIILSHRPKFVISKYQRLIYANAEKFNVLREEIKTLNELVHQGNSSCNAAHLDDIEPVEKGNNTSSSPAIITPATDEEYHEYYASEMRPANSISYPSRGAKIINPRITTLNGKVVNHLIARKEYIYTYTVDFQRSTAKVRFGMLIKTVSGFELAGATLYATAADLDQIVANSTIEVKFKFKCLLNPGVYFLNAGVMGIIDQELTYMARCIDIAMFRVQPCQNSCGTAIVDLLIEPSLTVNSDLISQEP